MESADNESDATDQHEAPEPSHPFPMNMNPAPDRADATNNPWYKRVPWRRVLEGIGVIAGIGYAVVTYFQWRDLRHNFEVDQRAWVRFGYATLGDKIDEKTVMNAWPLTVQNVGKSPAFAILVNGQFEIVPKTVAPSFSFSRPHTLVQVSTLFPTDSSGFSIALQSNSDTVHTISIDEIHDLTAGRSYLAVFAVVTYQDQFGPHWTRFCTWKGFPEKPGNFSARDCVAWNSAGDGEAPK